MGVSPSLLYFKMVQTLVVLSALVAIAVAGTISLDQAAKDEFVSAQNAYRKAAGGAGMPDLVWDDDLAAFAGRQAGYCKMEHAKNNVNGENIYWDWGPGYKAELMRPRRLSTPGSPRSSLSTGRGLALPTDSTPTTARWCGRKQQRLDVPSPENASPRAMSGTLCSVNTSPRTTS